MLGTLGEVSSPLKAPSSINYLAVRLKAGETWRYDPPADHSVCWVALASGRLAVPEPVEAGELVAFETSDQAIDFHAEADTEFVLGSAASHPYELALGYYSVHTSPASLHAGEQRIAEIKVAAAKGRPVVGARRRLRRGELKMSATEAKGTALITGARLSSAVPAHRYNIRHPQSAGA